MAESDDCFPNDPIKPHLRELAPGHRCPVPVCVVSVSMVSFAIDVGRPALVRTGLAGAL